MHAPSDCLANSAGNSSDLDPATQAALGFRGLDWQALAVGTFAMPSMIKAFRKSLQRRAQLSVIVVRRFPQLQRPLIRVALANAENFRRGIR